VARACERPDGREQRRARESVVRSNAEDHRRGWGGVRCGAVLCGVGLKGAVARAKHDDASTAAKERQRLSEERSESRESSRLGLWRCPPSIYDQLFISDGDNDTRSSRI